MSLNVWIALTLNGCTTSPYKSENTQSGVQNSARGSESAISVSDLTRHSADYSGRRLKVQGFLVIEPENRNLWERGETYGSNDGSYVSVEVTDALFNRRESLNRREVVLSALIETLESDDGSVDSSENVRLSNVADVVFVKALDQLNVVPADAEQGWFEVNQSAADMTRLRELATELSRAIRKSNNNDQAAHIAELVPARNAAQIYNALKENGSRARWLLFDWSESFATLMRQGRFTSIDVAQEPNDSASAGRRGAVCFCARTSCDPRTLSPQRVYFRGAADPYHCFPVSREDQRWVLDAGYLLGRPEEDVIDDEPGAAP